MEIISVKNLSFSYEGQNQNVLQDITLSVNKGEVLFLCGISGCGKTTLLRLLKEEIKPKGILNGDIKLGCPSTDIAYLFQNPESQIVCETVEEELVFGAENIGMKREEIARSVAEISAYLGIEDLLHKKTSQLSGGQKQMMNLASLLLMKPKILLLDEPVSQLDPVSTYDFLHLLHRLKEDLNLTILLVEHNLDELLYEADRVLCLEQGKMEYLGEIQGFLEHMAGKNSSYWKLLPKTVQIYMETIKKDVGTRIETWPHTVRDLYQCIEKETLPLSNKKTDVNDFGFLDKNLLVEMKHGYFRYEKKTADVLRDCSLTIESGKIYGLVGGNGVGKSTLLSVLSGYRKLYRGKCKIPKIAGVLPQNPVYAFFKDVYQEDLEMLATKEKIDTLLEQYDFCKEISEFLKKNPLDLSGGQMQKAAIFKMLLQDADLLLMDEPVKGMDGHCKQQLAQMLSELKQKGKTIVFTSHDLEFVQDVADECLMMFDGQIIAREQPVEMFLNNRFYTTVNGRLLSMMKEK